MRTLIVIPARLESTRLPRKLLLAETGMPLLAHTFIQACKTKIASDEPPAIAYATSDDWSAIIIGPARFLPTGSHPNGTSRMAEVADYSGYDCYVDVQADEPEIDPRLIDEVVQQLEHHPEWDCATAAIGDYRSDTVSRASPSSNVVKVQVTEDDVEHDWLAHDFSRSVQTFRAEDERGFVRAWHHIGIYAYRREALLKYAAAGPCQREQDESLEQLRALHIGLRMGVVLTDHQSHGIDTREDYDAFVKRWRNQHPEPLPQ